LPKFKTQYIIIIHFGIIEFWLILTRMK